MAKNANYPVSVQIYVDDEIDRYLTMVQKERKVDRSSLIRNILADSMNKERKEA